MMISVVRIIELRDKIVDIFFLYYIILILSMKKLISVIIEQDVSCEHYNHLIFNFLCSMYQQYFELNLNLEF